MATRRQVSSIVLSIGSPAMGPFAGCFSRYFMSQICCEIEATTAISKFSLRRTRSEYRYLFLYEINLGVGRDRLHQTSRSSLSRRLQRGLRFAAYAGIFAANRSAENQIPSATGSPMFIFCSQPICQGRTAEISI